MKTIVDEINELRSTIAKYEERKERNQADLDKCKAEMLKLGFVDAEALKEGIAGIEAEIEGADAELKEELMAISDMLVKHEQ